MTKTSQLRQSIAPGTVKYFSDIISADNLRNLQQIQQPTKNSFSSYDNSTFVKIDKQENNNDYVTMGGSE